MNNTEHILIEVHRRHMSWRNSFRCTPPPKYRNLLQALTEANEDKSVGKTLNYIVKDWFDKLPKDQQYRLMKSKHHY